jgi:predicted AAA+ superfamily ATPase
LNTLQTILDDKRSKAPKFYLTGSSARKLRHGQANLLPGRIFAYELGPLTAAELSYQLNVPHALEYGCLPEPYLSRNDSLCQKLLATYSGVYLKEEVQAEAMTRNLEGFSRFIAAAAQNSGKILDFSKLAKQARIERKLCSRFYEILEDTLIAVRLEVFADTDADISKRPKFYFFDTGVLNGLLENFAASNDRKGMLFEHLVINQIISSAKARDLPIKLSYFRTRGGYEVDLIVQMRSKTYAVEIKSGRVDQADASRLQEFAHYHGSVSEFFIVTTEAIARTIDGVRILTVNDFLQAIKL